MALMAVTARLVGAIEATARRQPPKMIGQALGPRVRHRERPKTMIVRAPIKQR
jgi:hypothetical protein